MKDKSTKQPWPRSARITVWVLGILLLCATSYIVLDVCQLDPDVARPIPIELPIEEPKEEDTPIIMPDLKEIERSGEEIYLTFEIS